ncbi:Protein BOBBER 1 [Diplonema papillatum]|nr:Protein BOBBER 1 [Diplonema papillatum]
MAEDEGTGIAPSETCGCTYEDLGYSWAQDESDVTVTVPIPAGTRGKMLDVQIGTTTLKAGLKGKPPVIDGTMFSRVKEEDSTWSIEDSDKLVLHLEKANLKYEEWWDCVVTNHPKINMKKLKPPPKKLHSLEEGAQATIEKMMFDQHQKRLGKPTSDELKMQEALEKFKEQFPGQPLPDLSNVKFTNSGMP